MVDEELVSIGARNLLINCAQLERGNKLLIVSEDEAYGWDENNVSKAFIEEAKILGIKVEILMVGEPNNSETKTVTDIIKEFDCTLFLARIGDQNRFETLNKAGKRVMCYARSINTLSSSFGTIDHRAVSAMKEAINTIFLSAKNITISCPYGTMLKGRMTPNEYYTQQDVGVLRFPMVVQMPIMASSFSGEVCIKNYLTSTGSKVYRPNHLKLSEPLMAKIKDGRIKALDGPSKVKDDFEQHYEFVSEKFNIDKYCVHSWHAGIHPGMKYEQSIADDPDRWSNTIFASPKFLHFHTCGNYPPGEICWMIENPTIQIDETPLWDNGVLKVKDFIPTMACLKKWPELKELYQ